MAASNRAKLITKLQTVLKKKYQAPPAQPTRPLLEHMLYACLLEDAPADLADEGFAKCEQDFYDWNEVRVTTVSELTQVLSRLPDAAKAAQRLKENLQAVFEEFYTFDLDHLKKENLGKAVGKFEKMPAMTPFVLSYTVQHGMGGHSIPIDYSAMVIMLATEIATQAEAKDGRVPGLERAIPKAKGIEFSTLLHEAAIELSGDIKSKAVRDLMDSVNKGSSDRLDEWIAARKAAKRRGVKRRAEEKERLEAEAKAAAEAAREATRIANEKAAKKAAAKAAAKSASKKKELTAKDQVEATAKKDSRAKSTAAKKKAVAKKKPATTKTSSKATTKKPAAKSSPAKKKTAKKAAVKKKTASKKTTAKKSTATKKSTTKKTAAKKAPSKKKSSASKSSRSKASSTKKASSSGKKATNRKLTKRKPR